MSGVFGGVRDHLQEEVAAAEMRAFAAGTSPRNELALQGARNSPSRSRSDSSSTSWTTVFCAEPTTCVISTQHGIERSLSRLDQRSGVDARSEIQIEQREVQADEAERQPAILGCRHIGGESGCRSQCEE